MVVAGLVGVASYYGSISGGATSQANLLFQGSQIKVNVADGSGSIYLKIYNQGPGAIRIFNITIKGQTEFKIGFGVPTNPKVQPTIGTGTLSGGPGVDTVAVYEGQTLMGIALIIPAGASASIYVTITSGILTYFAPGATYDCIANPYKSPAVPFTIQSQ